LVTARPTPPVESEPLERPPDACLIGVRRVAGEQCLDQRRPRGVGELRRERARERLDVALEQDPNSWTVWTRIRPSCRRCRSNNDRGRAARA